MEGRVDHKTDNLNTYLTSISGSLDEKTEIVPFIEATRRNSARFLEIGSGGDPVAAMVKKLLKSDTSITIEVIDADPDVLNGLVDRHPNLIGDASKKGIDILMTQMDATDMHEFENNSFDGINASSLVHEIFSYADGFRGVARFVGEINRVLKPEGVLFYRDPELNDSLVYSKATLDDRNLKALAFFYLANALAPKSADDKGSKSGLGELYTTAAIHMSYYSKSSNEQIVTSAEDLADVMMDDVDFDRKVVLYSEHGVVKELMRHFLTFHQSSPYGTIHFTPVEDTLIKVHYVSSNTADRWNAFLKQNKIPMSEDKTLTPANYELAQFAMQEVFSFMQNDVELILEQEQVVALGEEVNIDLKQISDDEKVYVVDSLQFSLNYEKLLQAGVINEKSFVNPTAFHFFQYLKQEVRETYFYLTPDELIAFVAEVSSRDNNGYILIPSEAESANRTTHRPKYDKFLRHSLSVRPLDKTSGLDLTPFEKKRLIKFTKKPYGQAVELLANLISQDEHEYPMTRQVYERLLKESLLQ